MVTEKTYRSELTPVDFLRRSARAYPDKIAVVHGHRRYSYARFAERVARMASGLHAAGLGAGDRVAVLSPNAPALLEAHFAVPAAGCVFVPINTRLQTSEIGYILSHSGARFLFVDEALYPQVADLDLAAARGGRHFGSWLIDRLRRGEQAAPDARQRAPLVAS